MSYRPIADRWILARPKVKYYGAYPNGFLERARVFLPVTRTEPVLHVCGGMAKAYPTWWKLCPNDVTIDLDRKVKPDLVWDVAAFGLPGPMEFEQANVREYASGPVPAGGYGWRGILADPPYTEEDADHYWPGRAAFPSAKKIVRDAMDVLMVGGRIGIIGYVCPRPTATGVKCVYSGSVVVGYGNRERNFSVYEKL